MPKKADHEVNRYKVCAPCGKKIWSLDRRILNTSQIDLIKKYLTDDFDIQNSVFPRAICNGCRLKFLVVERDEAQAKILPTMPNYSDLVLPRPLRSVDDPSCFCYICITSRQLGRRQGLAHKGGRGKTTENVPKITVGHGLFGSSPQNKPASIEKTNKDSDSSVICKKCRSEIGKGLDHKCNISSASVVYQVLQLPENQQDKVVHAILKKKALNPDSNNKNIQISLKTYGPNKTTVVMNPKKTKRPFFSAESLDDFQTTVGKVSNNDMKLFTNFIRSNAGRDAIPSHYKEHLTEQTHRLENYYKKEIIDFKDSQGNTIWRPTVWVNAEEIVDAVISIRQFEGRPFIKVMADGGQGSLKICLTVLPEGYEPDMDGPGKENVESPPKKKRSLYEDGGTISVKRGKLTGVKKLIMLCIAQDVPENHSNMQKLFELTALNDISFAFVADFKLLLICIGCQTAVASFPCPYCYISLSDMRNGANATLKHESRTFGTLRQDHNKFQSACDSDTKQAKFAHNTVNCSLFIEESDATVLEKCKIAELHIMMGFVNHVFFNGLCKEFGREVAMKWPISLHLVSVNYHGEVFEGNAARKLLKSSDRLLSPEVLGDCNPIQMLKYVSAFKAMDKIVNACFGTAKVTEDIETLVDNLLKIYLGLDLSITLKMHVIFEHLSACVKDLGGRGLGLYSEQAGESIHREFQQNFWLKYKIKDINHPKFLDNLFSAVVEFSSKHI